MPELEHTLQNIAKPYLQKILDSTFIQQLLSGHLSEKRFCHYLSQDSLYLVQEAKLLWQLSQKSYTKKEKEFFLAMSKDCIAIEQEMQATFFQKFTIVPELKSKGQFASYIHFLQTQLLQPFALAIFAYYPCYYLYAQLGEDLTTQQKTPNNKYQAYLDTYAGEPYKYFVEKYLVILQKYYKNSSPSEQKIMVQKFKDACHYESKIFQEV